MSRIGKAPVYFEKPVTVAVKGQEIEVKGAKATLLVPLHSTVSLSVDEGVATLSIADEVHGNFHGLTRALLQNAVTGVSKGWNKDLELNGVGYRASVSGKKLELNLGYSHPISFPIPDGIEIKVEKQTKISVAGPDRQKVGQVASVIRGFRPPEPYLGKGVKYADEHIRRKAGKAAGK